MIKELLVTIALGTVLEAGVTHYEGWGIIGIRYSSYNSEIVKVIKDSPADRAGIMRGDYLVNHKDIDIGEPGTEVKVKISRKGHKIKYILKRQDINTISFDAEDVEIKRSYENKIDKMLKKLLYKDSLNTTRAKEVKPSGRKK